MINIFLFNNIKIYYWQDCFSRTLCIVVILDNLFNKYFTDLYIFEQAILLSSRLIPIYPRSSKSVNYHTVNAVQNCYHVANINFWFFFLKEHQKLEELFFQFLSENFKSWKFCKF